MIFINIIDRFYTFHLPFSCLIYHPSVIRHRSYRVENIHVNQDTKVDKRQSPCTLSVTSIKNIRIYLFAGQSFRTNSELFIFI